MDQHDDSLQLGLLPDKRMDWRTLSSATARRPFCC